MKTLSLAALMVAAILTTTSALADSLAVENAWARASIGTTGASAAYLVIRNAGETPDRLISAAAPVAKRVELHTHIMENGTARMREVDGIDVPAAGMAMLEPGGYHVMLMGLNVALVKGESFPLTLTFERGGSMTVDVAIQELGAKGHGGHHKHGG